MSKEFNYNRNTQSYKKTSFGKGLLQSVIIGGLSFIVRYFIK